MKRQRIVPGMLAVALLLALRYLYIGRIPAAHAASIVVNTTDDELNSDGDCSLREAIQAANSDTAVDKCTAGSGADTITLPAGFYTLTILGAGENANASGDLDITDDLTINGGEGGITVIQAGSSIYDGIDRVLDVRSGTVELNHLWIEYGRTPGTTDEQNGGGIRNDTTSMLTLNNSYVSSNTADWYGGGIFNRGTLMLDNSTVGNSSAVYGGGGIYNVGTLTLTHSTVGNNAVDFSGGGIWNTPLAKLTLDNSSVSLNSATLSGGGILNEGGTLALYDSTVADNDGDSDHDLSGNGGGICNYGATIVELNRSTISGNNATNGGGIYNHGDSTVILSRSTVADNDCAYSGGGVYNDNSLAILILHMSTVSGNNAALGNGGGIYNQGGDLSLDKCTVSGNTGGSSGGGIYSAGSLSFHYTTIADNRADGDSDGSGDGGGICVFSGMAQARNSIIGDNQDGYPQAPDCSGTLTSQGYNLLEDTTGCTFTPTTGDITGSDPNLGALGDNGGPTSTHALQSGSPAIEQIPDGIYGCQAAVSVDQRGYLRAGGAGHGGSLCDIGAYEYDSEPFRVYLPLVAK